MKYLLLGSISLLLIGSARSQTDTLALKYAATITPADLQQHLRVLASDEYEGRDTGKPGQKKAAQYLKEQFSSFGIPPINGNDRVTEGYFQPFELVEERAGSISIEAKGRKMGFMKEILYFNEFLPENRTIEQVWFLGDGRNMGGIGTGEAVMLVDDGSATMIEFMGWLQAKADEARSAGASLFLVSTPRVSEMTAELGHFISGSKMRLAENGTLKPRTGMQTILIDRSVAADLLTSKKRIEKQKRGRVLSADFTLVYTPQVQNVISENVLGYIEGVGRPEELLVLTAHYDHIGMEDGQIYNGADDDGSGTVALIEMAQAFAEAKKAGHGPKRSVLIMPVSAEEKGLLGSKYYSENPVFPLENTIANLNIDMIGRTDSAHAGGDPYVYVIGSDRLSTQLHEINERANSTYTKLELDYTFNAEDDLNKFYYRSDHYNFARKGVPAIFYFSGVHEDYHKPTDTEEKIEYDKLHQRALLVFHTAWILANQADRIVVDKPVR